MSLKPQDRLDPYKIPARIGADGMARCTRRGTPLNRTAAMCEAAGYSASLD